MDVVKLLLEAGASPISKKASNDITPIVLARANHHEEVLAVLNEWKIKYPFKVAREARTPEKLQQCLNDGVDVDVQDSEGCTMLFFTCGFEYEEASKVLLEAGADPNIKDNYGRSPLDLAIKDSVRLLLLKHIKSLLTEDLEPDPEIDTHDQNPRCTRKTLDIFSLPLRTFCDRCAVQIPVRDSTVFFYHCCLCQGGDYDICSSCQSEKQHCLDSSHSLRVRVTHGGFQSWSEYSPWVANLKLPIDEPNGKTEKDG
ncbi:ankyrin repeat-containing domain protein [Tuber indicum]|nr:ankyrin repeat-containing domain protein [Tuber indicum]